MNIVDEQWGRAPSEAGFWIIRNYPNGPITRCGRRWELEFFPNKRKYDAQGH